MIRRTQHASAVLNSIGAGEVRFGPVAAHDRWSVELLTLRRMSAGEPYTPARAFVRVGPDSSVPALEGTESADLDTSDTVHTLTRSEVLIVQFEAGDPGDIYSATIRYVLEKDDTDAVS